MVAIDKKQFESLCGLQCTRAEICGFFSCDPKTLNSWCRTTYGETFSKVFEEKKLKGNISLRRNQMKLSETSTPMAIWLGKQYLGQEDHPGRETVRAEEKKSEAITLEDLYG